MENSSHDPDSGTANDKSSSGRNSTFDRLRRKRTVAISSRALQVVLDFVHPQLFGSKIVFYHDRDM